MIENAHVPSPWSPRRPWMVLEVLPLLIVTGCGGLAMQNPIATGRLQPNRVLNEHHEAESFRRLPPGTLAWGASLVSIDQDKACFDVELRSLPDSQRAYDVRTAEILLNVDGRWQRENRPELSSEAPVASYVDGMVPHRRQVEVLECIEHYRGTCIRRAYRARTRTTWSFGSVEVLSSRTRACFRSHGITAATKKVRLDVNIPEAPGQAQGLLNSNEVMTWDGVRRLAYRWTFDPKGQGTPGAPVTSATPAAVTSTSPPQPNAAPTRAPAAMQPGSSPAQTAPQGAPFSFRLTGTSFKAFQTLPITYSQPVIAPDEDRYSINLVMSGAPDQLMNNAHTIAPNAVTDMLVAPAPGTYEVRLHDHAAPYRVLQRMEITVTR